MRILASAAAMTTTSTVIVISDYAAADRTVSVCAPHVQTTLHNFMYRTYMYLYQVLLAVLTRLEIL
jgi:hypothetical protein